MRRRRRGETKWLTVAKVKEVIGHSHRRVTKWLMSERREMTMKWSHG